MKYRRLGKTGLKLSEISLGIWQNFENEDTYENGRKIFQTAFENGVNFIDGAEGYGDNIGFSEQVAGKILRSINPPRDSYAVSAKLIPIQFGHSRPVMAGGLNRKHIVDGCDEACERFGVKYIDLYFCHRPDPDTELEETCFAMTELIRQGKVLYWGTSCFTPEQFVEIYTICERYNLYKPSMEQCEYNLLTHDHVETKLFPFAKNQGLGITAYAPMAGGILSGKYLDGVTEGSRVSRVEWFRNASKEFLGKNEKIVKLKELADSIELSVPRLALALTLKNPLISTLICGASTPEQLAESCMASEDSANLSPSVTEQGLAIFGIS